MNKKYLIGLLVAGVFIYFAIMSFDKSKAEYTDFRYAQSTHKTVQVAGVWVKTLPYDFNSETQSFTFYMKDTTDFQSKVVYQGSMPSNFKLAPRLVVKGRFEDTVFVAKSILTKCPSKYETDTVIE